MERRAGLERGEEGRGGPVPPETAGRAESQKGSVTDFPAREAGSACRCALRWPQSGLGSSAVSLPPSASASAGRMSRPCRAGRGDAGPAAQLHVVSGFSVAPGCPVPAGTGDRRIPAGVDGSSAPCRRGLLPGDPLAPEEGVWGRSYSVPSLTNPYLIFPPLHLPVKVLSSVSLKAGSPEVWVVLNLKALIQLLSSLHFVFSFFPHQK